ncbi:Holliday junction branch migration protein RuvA [Ruminococcus albus]|jgi:Holliday junction DNA helicase RuvA|uniref:Holliday junction branch migration complex subunit RuvA n=1 Tax=Ruminococcus albus SY3 TaxID=1341156 RepID=A0A011UIV7_RUMAL|nr:Holliday junction branch migration protein RuvA [Ruminococcus albus]EXM40594.1 ATP-dependent DNA helicase RuvA [Ruminococcus albus SY3]MBE6868708.1 Holliday junction branch migration protein RuvA [Ruminococcus albus]MBP5268692.1 Holliday junction branch migration protein RuvA [Ruminococcus sp.]
MIYSVRGKLIHTESELAVVECGGVGYACKTTFYTLQKIAGESEVTLYTYLAVRENDVDLFGFSSQEELRCFKMLITVSGVGPKAALSILSSNTPSQFALTVATGDFKSLTKSKGIGAKTAQRIVLELKDKIAKENTISVRGGETIASAVPQGGALDEAITALVVLGYSEGEAAQALAGAEPTATVEELIKTALVRLARF